LAQDIVDLDTRFGIAGAARVVSGNNGLAKVVVSAPDSQGEIYLHGAHVTSWVRKSTADVLYVSPSSLWEDGGAIRGGVPVSFPWFADKANDPAAPAHGFVRTKAWQLDSIKIDGAAVTVSLFTESDEETRKWWPFDFRIVCRATFGIQLKIELTVTNPGTLPFSFEEALHAYFRVGNAETGFVRGLEATEFIDKTDQHTIKTQSGDLRIKSETDSVYLNTQHQLELFDPVLERRITIQKQNSYTTVVWNPWAEKSCLMGDLGADRWKDFVCLETSNVSPFAVKLNPGQQHTLAAVVEANLLAGSLLPNSAEAEPNKYL